MLTQNYNKPFVGCGDCFYASDSPISTHEATTISNELGDVVYVDKLCPGPILGIDGTPRLLSYLLHVVWYPVDNFSTKRLEGSLFRFDRRLIEPGYSFIVNKNNMRQLTIENISKE